MTEIEATKIATSLLSRYGDQGFEISMPDKIEYDLMRTVFARLGRLTRPDGDLFVIRVSPTIATS